MVLAGGGAGQDRNADPWPKAVKKTSLAIQQFRESVLDQNTDAGAARILPRACLFGSLGFFGFLGSFGLSALFGTATREGRSALGSAAAARSIAGS